MSTMPTWKICRKCGKPYSYNPSVGEFKCPDCLSLKMQMMKKAGFLYRKIETGQRDK